MNQQIQFVRENINRLTTLIQAAMKDEIYNKQKLVEMQKQKNEYSLELSRLIKEEWEATHERLDYAEDRRLNKEKCLYRSNVTRLKRMLLV